MLLALELRLLIEEVLKFDVEDGCFHPLVDVVFDVVVGEGDYLFVEHAVWALLGLRCEPFIILLFLHLYSIINLL